MYATYVGARRAPHDMVVGFIYGTGIRVARPGRGLQPCMYSGHERDQMMKSQSAVTPDALMFLLHRPVECRRQDMTMYNEAGMDARFAKNLMSDGVRYCLYGDKAFVL